MAALNTQARLNGRRANWNRVGPLVSLKRSVLLPYRSSSFPPRGAYRCSGPGLRAHEGPAAGGRDVLRDGQDDHREVHGSGLNYISAPTPTTTTTTTNNNNDNDNRNNNNNEHDNNNNNDKQS